MNILLLFRRQARFASIGAQKKMFQPEQNTPWLEREKILHRLCFLITHEHYRRVLRHLRENTLSASDLSRIQERADLPVAALPGHPRSPQGHDGCDIKNRCSAESQQINDHPLRWQRVLCFLASQHRQYAVFSSWSGMGDCLWF